MLGRYAADRTITNRNANIRIVHEKLVTFYTRFSHTFQSVRDECNCNQTMLSRMKCDDFLENVDEFNSEEILNVLMGCFDS